VPRQCNQYREWMDQGSNPGGGWDFPPVQTGPGPTQLPIDSVIGVKRQRHGGGHPTQSSAEVKEQGYNSTPLWDFMICSKVNFTIFLNRQGYGRKTSWSEAISLHLPAWIDWEHNKKNWSGYPVSASKSETRGSHYKVGVPQIDHVWNNTMKNNNGDKIWSSHSDVPDDSSHPGYDAVSLGRWFVMWCDHGTFILMG